MLETFEVGTFAPRIGEVFRIEADASGWVETTLIEATPLGGGGDGDAEAAGRRAPFSLVFRGPRDRVLPQRIYRIAHDELGEFELFLVPIGPDGEGMRYEAIFA